MKKRTRMLLAALVLALLLAAAAAAAEAPDLTVDGGGRVDFRGPAGETLYLAAYDPATGRFLGLLENGSLVRDSAALKLIAVNAAFQPTEEAARVLVISGPGTYGSGGFDAYDQVVVTAGADGKVTLENLTVGSLTVYGGGDLDLKDVTVTGELRVETAGEPAYIKGLPAAASARAAAPSEDGETGLPSIRILGTSGVGSIRIVQTSDGGLRLRTEEGCRVDWVLVDDGRGEIILDGDFNQVVVDTAGAGVHLEGAEVSGLTVKKAGADVTLDGKTSVNAVSIPAEARGAALTAEAGSTVACVKIRAEQAALTGGGQVIRAEVSGGGTRVETLGTWLSVEKDTAGVTQQGGAAVAPGVTIRTGSAAQGGSDGKPDAPESHAHLWAEGYRTEATAEREGTVCMVCTVCGITQESTVSLLPYAVTVYAGQQDETGETNTFATLEEAFAWAEAHASRIEDPEENRDRVCFPAICLVGGDVVGELRIPAGHTLSVEDGGRLTVLNGVLVGAGSAPGEGEPGEIISDGLLTFPLWEGMKNALNIGGQVIYDAQDPENSCLVPLPEADYPEEARGKTRDHTIFLGGGESAENGWLKPAFSLGGCSGEAVNGYLFQKDCDLRNVFCGLRSDGLAPVTVAARVWADHIAADGDASFRLAEGGAMFAGDLSLGFTEDCAVQVTVPEGASVFPEVTVRDSAQLDPYGCPTGYSVLGGSLVLHGRQLWPSFLYGPREDDPAVLRITIAEDARVTLPEGFGWVMAEVSTLVNRGTLILRGDLMLPEERSFRNEGTLTIAAFSLGDGGQEEDSYGFGRLQLLGASMENTGTVTLEQIGFTNSEGLDDGRFAELRAEQGALLTNGEEGFLDNRGFIFLRSGAVLDNRGLMRIADGAFAETDPAEELWVSYGGEAPEQEQSAGACTVRNSGVLENDGRLELRGSSLENTGTLTNRQDFQVKRTNGAKRTVTLEAAETPPETDEDWDSFWNWLDHDEGSWWRVTDDAFEEGDPFDSRFANGAEGSFLNENSCFLQADILNEGTFTNGSLTAVGEEESGSGAWLRQEGGSFENRGAVVNNGRWEFEDASYRQSADARFATYNQDGFEVRGGSLTVPSGSAFKNEGYMRLTDRYGEGYAPVDISGFEDFYTAWNQDGNDSNWCDTAAEVYDQEGYLAAAAAQRERRRLNPNTCYSRCDFCGDVTITEDMRFADFREYWLLTRGTDRWHLWDEETEEWTDCDPDAEGAEPYWAEAGSTLTVAEGATLTLARGSSLRVTGAEEQMAVFIPCLLEVKGTLVLEEAQEGDEENDWEWIEEAFVEIWDFGSFDASAGTVENRGRFEIRWREFGRGEETAEGFLYYPEGRFERPEACPVKGAPDNAVHAAEARTDTGFRNAAASTAPVFYRIYLREDCNVTVGEDLTVAPSVNVEPGSGILVEHGAALTLEGHLWNDGDISVYGDLIVLESADINQHMELGALTGSEEARLIICGIFSVRDHADLTVYPTGSILVLGGELDWRPGSGAAVKVLLPEGVTPEEATDAPVRFLDPDGLVITAEAPVRIDLNVGSSFTLNGIAVGGEGPEDYDGYCGCVSTRFETGGNGEEWRVLQADGDGPGRIVLSGTLAGFEEVRIMKGSADISGLDTGEAVIRISDMWTYTDVNVGSHAVILCESSPEDEGGHGGFGIAAGEGAEIRVEGALMLWDEEADFYGYSTGLTLTVGETTYELSPHIFGARYGDPAVYIGIGDPRAEYELRLGDETLEFEKECPVDGEEKTHLNPPEGKPWFEAGPEHDPGLTLVIRLPEGVTVTFVHVPVKPDWRETED